MHPVLFELPVPWGDGVQPIYSYGVMLAIALLGGWQIVKRLGARDGLSEEILGNAYFIAALGGLVGARLLYVLTNLEEVQESGAGWLDFGAGGVVAYGGFLGGLATAAVYLRYRRQSLRAFADAAAPALASGTAITRIGCYLYGCDFGKPLADGAPEWLARLGTFPHWVDEPGGLRGSPAWAHHVDRYGLMPDSLASLPVHPTQLYESLAGLALAVGALLLWQRRRFRGQVILAVTFGYGVWRFAVEYLRDDPERGELFGFSTSQLISLLLVPLAGLAYSALKLRARREEAAGT